MCSTILYVLVKYVCYLVYNRRQINLGLCRRCVWQVVEYRLGLSIRVISIIVVAMGHGGICVGP